MRPTEVTGSPDVRVRLFDELVARIEEVEASNKEAAKMSAARRRAAIEHMAADLVTEFCGVLPTSARAELIGYLVRMAVGYGPLDPLLADDGVSDVIVVDSLIRCERNGTMGTEETSFACTDHARLIIERLLMQSGATVDYTQPVIDAPLADGGRMTVVIPPAARVPVAAIRLKRGRHARR